MALEIKFDYAITSDRTKLVITDTTGVYSVNNLTGWGAPNTERSTVGLYAYVTYQPFDKPRETVTNITPVFDINGTYTNSHVSIFEFNFTKDGWYRILLVALTQAEFNAVTAPETLINHITYPNTFVQDLLLPNIIVQRNCLLEQYLTCLQTPNCKCDVIQDDVTKLNILIQGADYRFSSLKEFEAQKMVEQLTKQYKCCK